MRMPLYPKIERQLALPFFLCGDGGCARLQQVVRYPSDTPDA